MMMMMNNENSQTTPDYQVIILKSPRPEQIKNSCLNFFHLELLIVGITYLTT